MHRESLRPSSETPAFEHREGERRANGAIKGDPGRRGQCPHRGLIDADDRQCGQGHEHISPTEVFRGSDGHAISPALIDRGCRVRLTLDSGITATSWPRAQVSMTVVAGLSRRPPSSRANLVPDQA
jgi:hypothetical protein